VEQDARLLELTADIVAAHLANNTVAVGDVAGLVQGVHEALAKLGTVEEPKEPEAKPAVSVRSSVKADHLVCLVCGSHQKTLRRHINVAHGFSPEEYRARFNLPASYPMVAPDYTDRRREIAHALGLGRSRKGMRKGSSDGGGAPASGGEAAPKPRRGRRKAS
jgi:predicted transcriptional regulator